MSLRPVLTTRLTVTGMGWIHRDPVADFSDGTRPAFRVQAHCRNCSWKGEARFPVGYRIGMWLYCPKCEVADLSARGSFLGRDEMTADEERDEVREIAAEMAEAHAASLQARHPLSASGAPARRRWWNR